MLATASSSNFAGIVVIVEVALVLISLLGIAWKGGGTISSLRLEQKGIIADIGEIKVKVNTIQAAELMELQKQISALTTMVTVLQHQVRLDPGGGG